MEVVASVSTLVGRVGGSGCELVQVMCGWDALCVRTYGQYCPIARASDLLAERWSIIILRNNLIGCRTFNEIADGAPGLSRGLLSLSSRRSTRGCQPSWHLPRSPS